MDALLEQWILVLGDDPASLAAGRDILVRYAEPRRRYHDRRHLAEVLQALRTLSGDAQPPPAVVLAAYLHDAVHDGRAGQDETRSADLAAGVLTTLGREPAEVAEVVRLVLLTADHDPDPGDALGALLCDADLAVLGAAPQRYRTYSADVRREYAHVPDREFRISRAAVLRTLAARRPLFTTRQAQDLWEAAARRNLQEELDGLGAGPPPAAG